MQAWTNQYLATTLYQYHYFRCIPLILPTNPLAAADETALTSHMTSFPSTPDVLTRVTFPGAPSYARTLVIVFWCTVKSSDSVVAAAVGESCALRIPRESAFLNVLNAALFSRPTGDAPPSPARAPPADLLAFGSSRLPVSSHPASLPEKTNGWQSWPAATSEFSFVQVRVTSGRVLSLIV